MLNLSKIICILSTIYWTLSNASVISRLLDAVLNLLVPGGVNNVGENFKLCSLEMVNPTKLSN